MILYYNSSLSTAQIQCCYTNGCNENIERAVQSKNWINEPISSKEMDIVINKVDYMLRMEKLIHKDNVTEGPTLGARSRSFLPEQNPKGAAVIYRLGFPHILLLLVMSFWVLFTVLQGLSYIFEWVIINYSIILCPFFQNVLGIFMWCLLPYLKTKGVD